MCGMRQVIKRPPGKVRPSPEPRSSSVRVRRAWSGIKRAIVGPYRRYVMHRAAKPNVDRPRKWVRRRSWFIIPAACIGGLIAIAWGLWSLYVIAVRASPDSCRGLLQQGVRVRRRRGIRGAHPHGSARDRRIPHVAGMAPQEASRAEGQARSARAGSHRWHHRWQGRRPDGIVPRDHARHPGPRQPAALSARWRGRHGQDGRPCPVDEDAGRVPCCAGSVRLRDVETELNFGEVARKQFCKEVDPGTLPEGQSDKVWRQLRRDDKIVVLADGLEEAFPEGNENEKDRDNLIRRAIQQAEEQKLPLVIASRPHHPLEATTAAIMELEPLSEEAALDYVEQDSGPGRTPAGLDC